MTKYLTIFIIVLVLLSCQSLKKIPLEKQGGCDFNPKDSTYSEWSLQFDKYPQLLNDISVDSYLKSNIHFSVSMIEHEISNRILVHSYLNRNGNLTNLRIYSSDTNFSCDECTEAERLKIKKQCEKESIRLLKGLKYSLPIVANKKVIIEMSHWINLDYNNFSKK